MSEEYKQYLKSSEWKEKRKQFIEGVGSECERCGSKKNLQIHHKNYDNVFDETEDDVEVLCKNCHAQEELEKGKDWVMDYDYGEW